MVVWTMKNKQTKDPKTLRPLPVHKEEEATPTKAMEVDKERREEEQRENEVEVRFEGSLNHQCRHPKE